MDPPVCAFLSVRTCRRIALVIAAAIVFAGLAQAAHDHKDELSRSGGTHVHCLLCLYPSGSAVPPTLPSVPAASPLFHNYRPPQSIPGPEGILAASYDARGPPAI